MRKLTTFFAKVSSFFSKCMDSQVSPILDATLGEPLWISGIANEFPLI